jgi:tetratricopeptide (TPR) repeat protein
LRNWSLFLNLGLVQLENGDLDGAAESLQRAMLLGEDHPESHYNLALVDERRGQFAEAEREMRASLRLDPSQPDALNALGVIYAEEGKTGHASQVWRELLRETPDYAAARKNLSLVDGPSVAASGETAAVVLPPAAAVNSIRDKPGITPIPRAICSSHSSCRGPSRAAWLNQDRTFPLLLSSSYRRRQGCRFRRNIHRLL